MSPITVHLLEDEDWQEYRRIRLDALQQSPYAFAATHAEEARESDADWRTKMRMARRLVARTSGETVGVVSVAASLDQPRDADLFGLWVAPQARQGGAARSLVEAAADVAAEDGHTHLYYWVGSENAPAIALASNLGFRVTSHRRPAQAHQSELGPDEVAFVMALEPDTNLVPTVSAVR